MVQRLGWLYLESEMGGSQSAQCQGGPGRGRPNRSAYQTKRCFFNQSGQPTVNDQLGHRHSDPFGQLGFHCKENNSPNIPYNRGVCPDSEGIHIRSSAWNSFHSGCLNDRGLKWPGGAWKCHFKRWCTVCCCITVAVKVVWMTMMHTGLWRPVWRNLSLHAAAGLISHFIIHKTSAVFTLQT